MADISFGHNVWLLVPAAMVAAALTWWTYRSTIPPLEGVLRWFVPALRLASLSLILFLLFEPILAKTERHETPATLAVLVDQSASLNVTATSDTVASTNQSHIRALLAQLPLEEIAGAVKVYGFGSDILQVSQEPGWADSLSFLEQRTDISLALQRVRDDLINENLRSVLLVSDGRHNTGRNPVFVAERYPVPIIASVVGDTTIRRDLYVRSVVANEIGYVNTELPVRAVVRSEGISGVTARVSLIVDGESLARETIRIEDGTEHTIDFAFTPTEAGLKRMRVVVSRIDGEVTYRNNAETLAIQVLDSKRSVLLVASSPGPDVSAVRSILEEDQNVDLAVSVYRQGSSYYGSPPPADLSAVDLLVLVGYPGKTTPADQVAALADQIGPGTGVLFLMGRDTDLAKYNRYLADKMPVRATTIRGEYLESTLGPSAASRSHPIFEDVSLSRADWDRLPPIQYNSSIWNAAPDARILATTRVRNVDLPDPILAVLERSRLRTAAMTAAGSWRWKNLPEDLDTYDDAWSRLLANLVTWLTAGNDDRRVRVRPVETSFAASDRIGFTGQVYDESLRPVTDAAVEISVRAPSGDRFPFAMDAAGNGRYTLQTDALPGGTYTYEAVASRDGVEIGRDQGSFAVGDLALEYRETRADPVLMRQVAQRSGGLEVPAERFSQLAGVLDQLGTYEPRVEMVRRETELWRRYIFLAVAVLLLTLEWFLRKRNGLV